MRAAVARFVEGEAFRSTVMAAVVINAVVLGVDTYGELPGAVHAWCARLDYAFVLFFVMELSLKLFGWRLGFFRNSWNMFDLAVVAASLVAGPFSVLRTLRVMRTLRLVSVVPSMRRVVEALIRAVPGIGAIIGVLAVFFYVGAVLTTNLFGREHPELFGTLGASVITLFQLMLFDGWASEVVRVVGAEHPFAPFFFIIFTVVTGFAVLNLFIAVMVDALRTEHDRLQNTELEQLGHGQKMTARGMEELDASIQAVEDKLDALIGKLDDRAPGVAARQREESS